MAKSKGEMPLDDAELYDGPETGACTDPAEIEKILDFIVDEEANAHMSVSFCTDKNDDSSYFAVVPFQEASYSRDGDLFHFEDEDDDNQCDFNLSEVFNITVHEDGSYTIDVELDTAMGH